MAEAVMGRRIGGGQLDHLTPTVGAARVALEQVGRAGIRAHIIVRPGPDHDRVPADRDGAAEIVRKACIGGGQLGHLAPTVGTPRVALEDVGRAGQRDRIGVKVGRDDDLVPADRDGRAENVTRRRIGGGQLGHLAPTVGTPRVALEDVGRAGQRDRIGVKVGRDDDRVPADRDGRAENVTRRRIGGGQLGHLAPTVGAPRVALEGVGRAGARARVVVLVGPDDDRVPADRDGRAENVTRRRIGGGQLGDLGRDQRIDHDRVARAGDVDLDTKNGGGERQPRLQGPLLGVVGHQVAVAQHRRTRSVTKHQRVAVAAEHRNQRARKLHLERQPLGIAGGSTIDGEPLLQTSPVVDVPLGQPRTAVLDPVAPGHQPRLRDRTRGAGGPEAAELHAPAPALSLAVAPQPDLHTTAGKPRLDSPGRVPEQPRTVRPVARDRPRIVGRLVEPGQDAFPPLGRNTVGGLRQSRCRRQRRAEHQYNDP